MDEVLSLNQSSQVPPAPPASNKRRFGRFLLINVVLGVLILGSLFYLVAGNKTKQTTETLVPTATPKPTESPTPTPMPYVTPQPSPTPKPTAHPTAKPTTQPQAAGSFTCTLFLGYSQTNNWFDEAEGVMGSANFEMMYINGGAAYKWGDAGYEGWRVEKTSACTQNASSPDRVVMDVTHNEYLNTKGDPVGFMVGVLQKAIGMIRTKYPSARTIVLQPVVGGPNHGNCTSANVNTESSRVRATVNHPFIHQAIDRLVGGDIVWGYDSQVGDCSQYEDSTGHLNSSGQRDVGSQIGSFYASR